jgi:hypothetical protein
MIRCRKCKKEKSVAFFTVSEVKSEYPICRACRKDYRPSPKQRTTPARGWQWRDQGNRLIQKLKKA